MNPFGILEWTSLEDLSVLTPILIFTLILNIAALNTSAVGAQMAGAWRRLTQ